MNSATSLTPLPPDLGGDPSERLPDNTVRPGAGSAQLVGQIQEPLQRRTRDRRGGRNRRRINPTPPGSDKLLSGKVTDRCHLRDERLCRRADDLWLPLLLLERIGLRISKVRFGPSQIVRRLRQIDPCCAHLIRERTLLERPCRCG